MNTMSTHRGARAHAHASSSLPYIACHSRAYRPVLLKQVRQQAGNQHICKAATRDTYDVGSATNIAWQEGGVSKVKKETMLQQQGCILWFTGLSGSGKSTIACTLEHALCERGHTTALLDGDNVRHGLNKDLGFSAEDRQENIRRVGEVAKLFADTGIITLVSFISPYARDRDAVRARAPGEFMEVYMKTPLEVCEQRDVKGLYKKARAGLIKNFTGIDDPYEVPEAAEVVLEPFDADGRPLLPPDQAKQLIVYLEKKGFLGPPKM